MSNTDAVPEPTTPKTPKTPVVHTAQTPLKPDRQVELAWRNMTYRVEVDNPLHADDPINQPKKVMRTLLHNMSGTARGSRVMAIMGPSGAGKTTLMSSFMGRLDAQKPNDLRGGCYVNGVPLTNEYKRLFSMVAQDDIVMGKETPWDALYFSARIRLGVSHEEASALAAEVIEQLHLGGCKDTIIGVPGHIKGISGGEKKRVNIGNELITNPYIMILDEPTTGLDSVNATRVGLLLQELAHDEGRTVVCTIHTPSSELFDLFDDLLLLAKGHVIYHGPRDDAIAYFASAGHPVPARVNPSEFYMDLLQMKEDEGLRALWENWEAFAAADAGKTNGSLAPLPVPALSEGDKLKARCDAFGSSLLVQYGLLTRRALRLWSREPATTFGRLMQNVFLAILLGLFFFNIDETSSGTQDVSGILFLLVINVIFGSAMPGLTTFSPERAVFLMEQSSEMYHPSLYVIAKFTAESFSQIFFTAFFTTVVYWMVDLHNSASTFFIYFFIMQLVGLCGYSFGVMTSAIFPSADAALIFAPVIIMPLMIVGGLFANTERLDPYWVWLNYISFPRYGYMALMVNEYNSLDTLCPADPINGNGCTYRTGTDYLTYVGFEEWKWWYSVFGLFGMMVLFLFLASLAMTILGLRRRGAMSFNFDAVEEEESADANEAIAGAAAVPAEAEEEMQPTTH